LVAATNRNLKQAVEAGQFRQDLFYRLSVFPVEMPPLREHPEDIPMLSRHFLEVVAKKMNLKPGRLTQAHVAQLSAYHWPGNVRELQNVIERAVILSQGGPLQLELLPAPDRSVRPKPRPSETRMTPLLTRDELKQRERESIREALVQTKGKVFGPGGAAELLGMKGTTLASRIKALRLPRP
jgi:transcriptional regulator with GAF, ATPase, and Fis domain